MQLVRPTLVERRQGRENALSALTLGLVLALVVLFGLTVGPAPADAHGAATRPGSRTYLCRIDGTHASGDINPSNSACAAAVAVGGKQPLWDWFGVLRSDGAGRTRGFIPDGQLCSGGEPKYAGYDLARTDWPYTSLTSGGDLTVRYNAWAAHPGEFRLYITKDGYDPTEPLGWDDLEDEPFSVYQQSSPNGTDIQNGSPDYQWNVTLPNKVGQHIIYSVWSRSDSSETFYGCSDVRFDGGSGNVFGVGAGANPVGPPDDISPADPPPETTVPSSTTTLTSTTLTSTTLTSTTLTSTTSSSVPSSTTEPSSVVAGAVASAPPGPLVVVVEADVIEAVSSSQAQVVAAGQEAATQTPKAATEVSDVPSAVSLDPAPVRSASSERIGWLGVLGLALVALVVGLASILVGSSSEAFRRFVRGMMPTGPPLMPMPPAAPRWPDLQTRQTRAPAATTTRQ